MGKQLNDFYKRCQCLKEERGWMLFGEKPSVSLAAAIWAFEDAAGYPNPSHARRLERGTSGCHCRRRGCRQGSQGVNIERKSNRGLLLSKKPQTAPRDQTASGLSELPVWKEFVWKRFYICRHGCVILGECGWSLVMFCPPQKLKSLKKPKSQPGIGTELQFLDNSELLKLPSARRCCSHGKLRVGIAQPGK